MNSGKIVSIQTASTSPDAYARIRGGKTYPELEGIANFYKTSWHTGIIVEIILENLPNITSKSPSFLGMHIHENGDCSDDFANTGMHYNPNNSQHPYHLGDLPSLLNSNGYGYQVFYDSYLSLDDIIGRSIIIHNNRDDFTSQPSGDSGSKIACGVITANAE